MKALEYSIIYMCTECNYLRSAAGFNFQGAYETDTVFRALDGPDECPHCHKGKVSISHITLRRDIIINDPYQQWNFDMKCGKCQLVWQSKITNKHSAMRARIFKPEISCPACNNLKDNLSLSIRRTA